METKSPFFVSIILPYFIYVNNTTNHLLKKVLKSLKYPKKRSKTRIKAQKRLDTLYQTRKGLNQIKSKENLTQELLAQR